MSRPQPAVDDDFEKRSLEDAIEDGFAGLAAAGDMTLLLDGAPGSEDVAEYEALSNNFYKCNRALGLCQYNRQRLPRSSIMGPLEARTASPMDAQTWALSGITSGLSSPSSTAARCCKRRGT